MNIINSNIQVKIKELNWTQYNDLWKAVTELGTYYAGVDQFSILIGINPTVVQNNRHLPNSIKKNDQEYWVNISKQLAQEDFNTRIYNCLNITCEVYPMEN